jgi:hypothetical protein
MCAIILYLTGVADRQTGRAWSNTSFCALYHLNQKNTGDKTFVIRLSKKLTKWIYQLFGGLVRFLAFGRHCSYEKLRVINEFVKLCEKNFLCNFSEVFQS